MNPDLYAVLGVPRDATQADIRHAYRALLRRLHPDTRSTDVPPASKSSEPDLQQILSAYAVVGDPAARADYEALTSRQAPLPQPRRAAPARPSTGRARRPPIQAGPVRWHSG
ncbi:MAG: J domain-containing protein [Actinomycetota bacterium]|nr:J domain-containing protein [Actinomycetota bacterium]